MDKRKEIVLGLLGRHNYSPSQEAGVLAAWEFDSLAGAEGSNVTSVNDLGSGGFTATQSVAGKFPLLRLNSINNHKSIEIQNNGFLQFNELTTIRTAYVVVIHNTGSQANAVLIGHDTAFDFAGGGTTILGSGSGKTSQFYINGAPNPVFFTGGANDSALALKPTAWSLVTLYQNANSKAKYITNDRNAANRYWLGKFAAVYLFSDVHDATKRKRIEKYFLNKFGIVGGKQVVYDGNSMTAGTGATTGNSYPSQTGVIIDPKIYGGVSIGVAGQTTAQMSADFSSQVAPLLNSQLSKNILICWEGTNDIYNGANTSTAYNDLVNYCNLGKTAGYNVILGNILPRQNVGVPAGFEATRVAVNNLLNADFSTSTASTRVKAPTSGVTYADFMVQLDQNPQLQDPTNATYFNADKVHLTDAGYAIVAADMSAAILLVG